LARFLQNCASLSGFGLWVKTTLPYRVACPIPGMGQGIGHCSDGTGPGKIPREDTMIRIRYDALNRTFKLVDQEFETLLQGDALYDLERGRERRV
jgi:hypothetical protein